MKTLLIFAFSFFSFNFFAQGQIATNNRVSPMDSVQNQIDEIQVDIIYSRPFLKGREFGKDIVPYGKVWRTGANEATVFEISQNALIEGRELSAGKYSLYTIPDENETVIIFNKIWDQWGTQYNESDDVLRVVVPTFKSSESTEQFTIEVDDTGDCCLTWGTMICSFEIDSGETKDEL